MRSASSLQQRRALARERLSFEEALDLDRVVFEGASFR
jgi:hypothetical protein